MRHCANCGAQLREDATFCFACNTRQDTEEEAPESPPTGVADQEERPGPNKAAETARTRHCANCGAELPEDATFCFACGTKCVSSTKADNRTSQRRTTIPQWLVVAIGICAIAVIGFLVWHAMQPDPATSVPTSATSEPTENTSAPPAVATSPSSLSLVGTVGEPGPNERINMQCSEANTSLTWHATRDARWLDLVPSTGSFDLGSDWFSVKVSTSGLEEGIHTGNITLSIEGFEDDIATIPVTLELQAPEDPEAEAARKFWESSTYRPYWESGAQTDVRAVVRDYTFPEYAHPGADGTVDRVDIKDVEFAYEPELYPRPIALVRCSAKFVVVDVEAQVRTTYITDTLVVLQVAPGPYSISHNDWEVVVAGDYERMTE